MTGTTPLAYFVKCWMHQDLDLDHGDIAGAAADFASHPPHDAEGLLGELKDVLERCPREGQLHRFFDRLNAQYVPQRPGELRRQLLGALEVLEDAVAERELLRSALAAVLSSWHTPSELDLPELSQRERRALHRGLSALLTSGIWDQALAGSIGEIAGQAVAAPEHEVRGRLQAVLDALDALP